MVGRQSLISKMDQVQILTGVNVHADTVEIFVKLVGRVKFILLRGNKWTFQQNNCTCDH